MNDDLYHILREELSKQSSDRLASINVQLKDMKTKNPVKRNTKEVVIETMHPYDNSMDRIYVAEIPEARFFFCY